MALAAVLFAGALIAAPQPEAPEAPRFTGTWERNPEESDDPEEKMEAAFEQMRERADRRGQRPGAGGPPGGGPGEARRGRGGRPGEGGGFALGRVPDELALELEGGELRMDDGERLRIYYLDGEKHRREMPNGAKLETTAVLQGSAVHIEEKMERGKIDRKLELAPDGETLVMTWTLKMGNMKEPVVIRTVYERLDEGSGGL